MNLSNQYFATCSKGVEDLVKAELEQLQIPDIKLHTGGVSFGGSLEHAYKACLWTRVASRILLQLKAFEIDSDDDLYDEIISVDWSQHFAEYNTLAIDCFSSHSTVTNSHYATLRVKDAIVDQFVENTDDRPSIRKDNPDIRLNVYLSDKQCLLYLDLSGEALHKRGYRQSAGSAPLRETLAASMLYRAKWNTFYQQGLPFCDPMCGSGTLLIEAAMMAADIAPGLLRETYGFSHWKHFDEKLWQQILQDAQDKKAAGRRSLPPIFGSDNSDKLIDIARKNINAAGLSSVINISLKDATADLHFDVDSEVKKKLAKTSVNNASVDDTNADRTSADNASAVKDGAENTMVGLLVSNPPYGKRIGQVQLLRTIYYRFGKQLKLHFNGWTVAIITSEQDLAKSLGLRAFRKNTLYNGAIKSVLYQYRIGSRIIQNTQQVDVADNQDSSTEKQLKSSHTAVSERSLMFRNRLAKNYKHLKKWARKNEISCYRVYDADLPQYAVAIDKYDNWIHIQEYQAPKTVDKNKAFQRINDVIDVVAEVLESEQEYVVLKVRKRQEGASQYSKLDQKQRKFSVTENGLKFFINIYDYIDTGLFLDHRITRKLIKQLAHKRSFLNLFAYTGSFTVFAAAGGASTTTTVDMSNTYLNWAQENMSLNGYSEKKHSFVRDDCLVWMQQAISEEQKFQLIFIDPPTFSNSKKMTTSLDINRDHVALLNGCLALLADDGQIIFSTNAKSFKLDETIAEVCLLREITAQTTTEDFRRKPLHRCWCLARQASALVSPEEFKRLSL